MICRQDSRLPHDANDKVTSGGRGSPSKALQGAVRDELWLDGRGCTPKPAIRRPIDMINRAAGPNAAADRAVPTPPNAAVISCARIKPVESASLPAQSAPKDALTMRRTITNPSWYASSERSSARYLMHGLSTPKSKPTLRPPREAAARETTSAIGVSGSEVR